MVTIMGNIKCLIVEDEIPAAKVISKYIQEIPGMEVTSSCKNAMEALNVLKNETIDLVFLDIQMPGINGIEFTKILSNSLPVILTTAYREFAVEGFELEVLDYLVKPISFERFFKAVSKIYKSNTFPTIPSREGTDASDQAIREFKSFDEMYIYVRVDKKMKQVWLKEIIYIESIGDYVKIITDHEVIVTYLKIGYLEKKLPGTTFTRIHRSFLISRGRVSSFTSNTIEIGNKVLPIGVNYKKKIHTFFFGHTP